MQTQLICTVVRKEVGRNLMHFETKLNRLFKNNNNNNNKTQHPVGHYKMEPILRALVLENAKSL